MADFVNTHAEIMHAPSAYIMRADPPIRAMQKLKAGSLAELGQRANKFQLVSDAAQRS
jgi:hypothetical protein